MYFSPKPSTEYIKLQTLWFALKDLERKFDNKSNRKVVMIKFIDQIAAHNIFMS